MTEHTCSRPRETRPSYCPVCDTYTAGGPCPREARRPAVDPAVDYSLDRIEGARAALAKLDGEATR